MNIWLLLALIILAVGIISIVIGTFIDEAGMGILIAIIWWIIGYVGLLIVYIIVWAIVTVSDRFGIPCLVIVAVMIILLFCIGGIKISYRGD